MHVLQDQTTTDFLVNNCHQIDNIPPALKDNAEHTFLNEYISVTQATDAEEDLFIYRL